MFTCAPVVLWICNAAKLNTLCSWKNGLFLGLRGIPEPLQGNSNIQPRNSVNFEE